MKKILYILTGVLLVASCSLKEDSSGIVNPYEFFKTKAQIRAAVNGCYDPLNGIHNLIYFIAVEGTTDLASTNGSSRPDAKLEISPVSPGAGTSAWNNSYTGIRMCLSTLAGIGRSEVADSEKLPLEVETRILLSYYYYVLTSFFGDVPFYEDYVETDEDIQRITALGRMSAVETRRTLIEELKLYVPALPQVRTCDQVYNYAGAAMGWMLIAKMAAWNKDWDEVIYACEHLEDIYGDLDQYPYTDTYFRCKNTPESIFEINHEYEDGGISYMTTNSLPIATVCMPYPKETGAAIYNGVTIPELGDKAYCYTPLRPTKYMKESVMPAEAGDIRRECNFSTSYGGVKYSGSNTWLGPKFWCPNMYQNHDNNNYKIFRYADALLLLAEAWCEKGNYPKSVEYLNKVRHRAQLPDYTFVTAVKLRGVIRDERGRELFGEFCRKYDLVRWGIWYDQVQSYNLYSHVQNNIRPCHEYYPIPDIQCVRSGHVLSNPEYNKYGL